MNKVKQRPSIAIYIGVITLAVFFIMSAIIASISYRQYRETFYEYSNEIVMNSTTLASYLIDGDLVEQFASTLKADYDYMAFAAKLDALRDKIHAKYLYVMVDAGVPGMYTYIYDAPNEDTRYTLGDNETITEYEGAAEVLSTGIGFQQAEYYDSEAYGELYYAYAPIRNSKGDVVAFVGVDVDISAQRARMGQYQNFIAFIVLTFFIIFTALYTIVISRMLTKPLGSIIENAHKLSNGDMGLSSFKASSKESSMLQEAFESVSNSITMLIKGIHELTDPVRNGYLGARAGVESFQGEYYEIVNGVNKTLDMISAHFNAMPEAMAFLSPNGTLRSANTAMSSFLKKYAISSEEILMPLLPQYSSGRHGDQGRYYTEISMVDASGKTCDYSVSVLHLYIGESSSHLMMIINDITSLHEAIREAEAASRAKSEFLSRMSHEIRTPINAVIGLSAIAKNATDLNKVRDCMSKIEASSNHLLGVINDILDFSKIEAGKLSLDNAMFSLTQDIHFVTSMFHSKVAEKQQHFELKIGNIEHDGIFSDSLRLNQVLLNLLANAVKFTGRGGLIELHVDELSHNDGFSEYAFTVKDSGIGMNKETVAKLFTPFEQADPSTTTRYGGTGLGLAISKSIINMMDGRFSVDSEQGKGSSFRFVIRVKAQKAIEGVVEDTGIESSMPDLSGKRVLIVDDIEINRIILLEQLKETKLAMETATNGSEALEKYLSAPDGYYDIIFMDVQMPVMDGYEATKAIRQSEKADAKDIAIIAMTANVLREDVEKALNSGMNQHIGKPVNLQELLRVLNSLKK